jgi:hypothetical protein
MLKQLKKIWLVLIFYKIWLLVIVLILIISLGFSVFRNYLLKKELAKQPTVGPKPEELVGPPAIGPEDEQQIEGQIAQCIKNFDLNKIDFTKPIWDYGLSKKLNELVALQAFKENNIKKCDYFKDKVKINLELAVENCLKEYRFLKATAELKEGISCQNYLEECKRFIDLDVDEKDREEAERVVCESLCQSYQNKTPIILTPENLCDKQPSPTADAIEYFDVKTNQSKICYSGLADEIKFLIAVSKNDLNICSTIKEPKASLYCQFFFDRNFVTCQDKFKEQYCHHLIFKVIIPNLYPGFVKPPE